MSTPAPLLLPPSRRSPQTPRLLSPGRTSAKRAFTSRRTLLQSRFPCGATHCNEIDATSKLRHCLTGMDERERNALLHQREVATADYLMMTQVWQDFVDGHKVQRRRGKRPTVEPSFASRETQGRILDGLATDTTQPRRIPECTRSAVGAEHKVSATSVYGAGSSRRSAVNEWQCAHDALALRDSPLSLPDERSSQKKPSTYQTDCSLQELSHQQPAVSAVQKTRATLFPIRHSHSEQQQHALKTSPRMHRLRDLVEGPDFSVKDIDTVLYGSAISSVFEEGMPSFLDTDNSYDHVLDFSSSLAYFD